MPGAKRLELNFDQILPYVGEYGRYQATLQAMFCFALIPMTFPTLIMYFAALQPKWQCVPNQKECLLNGTVSASNNQRCNMTRSAWKYAEPDDYSIVTQFDIYCDKDWMIHITTSIMFIGWVFGAIILGWVADNYGRKIVLFPSMGVLLIIGFLSAFSPNISVFIVSRFIVGFFVPGTSVQMFILISELVGTKYRAAAGIGIWAFFTLGLCIMGLKSYLVPRWSTLYIICHAPYIIVLLFWWFTPESIRWLHSRGEIEKAMAILKKVASMNKKEIPDHVTLAPPPKSENEGGVKPSDLFRTRDLTVKSSIQGKSYLIYTTPLEESLGDMMILQKKVNSTTPTFNKI